MMQEVYSVVNGVSYDTVTTVNTVATKINSIVTALNSLGDTKCVLISNFSTINVFLGAQSTITTSTCGIRLLPGASISIDIKNPQAMPYAIASGPASVGLGVFS